MAEIFRKNINISLFKLILITLISLLVVLAVGYYYLDEINNPKISAIINSFSAGILLLGFQVVLSKHEIDKSDFLKKLGVVDVIRTRRDKLYYSRLIDNAETEILVLGMTAYRLLDDFASKEDKDSQNLIDALGRGVKVKILVASDEYLDEKEKSDIKTIILNRAQEIKIKYPRSFELKRYSTQPMHSVFKIDDECIAGPIFSHIKSKNSPGIVMASSSQYIAPYLDYFNKTWGESDSIEIEESK